MKRSKATIQRLGSRDMKRGARPSSVRQRGLSLLELMIGITIGLLVSLAALGTATFMRTAYVVVSDTTRMEQDASVGMRMIGQQVKQARAIALVTVNPGAGVRFATYTGIVPPLATIGEVAAYGVNGALTDSFTVSFSVSPGGNAANCLGFPATLPGTGGTTVSSGFDVNNGALRCNGSGAGSQEVITNVEELQVLYGQRDGVTGNIRYQDATAIGANGWPFVGSIMVCLRLVGTSRTAPQPPTAAAPFLDCNGNAVAWDGRFRRTFRQVFTLRNPA